MLKARPAQQPPSPAADIASGTPFGARAFLRFFYWRLRSPLGGAGHMLAVLASFVPNAVRLIRHIRMSRDRRPAMAIVFLQSMGDIVAAEPVARLARQRFPAARIHWITCASYASLPAIYPEVDHVVVVRCLTEWMLLQRLGLFDVVWDLHLGGYGCRRCRILRSKPDGVPNEENYYDYGNLLDIQCLIAGLPRLTDGPRLTLPPAAVTAVDALALPPRFIVIHCVSNDPGKNWPVDKWRELIARVLAADPTMTVVEVGTRPVAVAQDGARRRALCGTLSIPETAEVIRRAALFIGIYSGPAHLANAVGTQGVILLGVYVGSHPYMPYSGGYASGETASILRINGPIADLPVDAVFAAVMART